MLSLLPIELALDYIFVCTNQCFKYKNSSKFSANLVSITNLSDAIDKVSWCKHWQFDLLQKFFLIFFRSVTNNRLFDYSITLDTKNEFRITAINFLSKNSELSFHCQLNYWKGNSHLDMIFNSLTSFTVIKSKTLR